MNKIMALVAAESRLLIRNRTIAVTAFVVPLAMGAFFMWNFSNAGEPLLLVLAVALQVAAVIAMSVYTTATLILVTRRQNRVLKRMRTSGISDTGLLVATIAPGVLVGLIVLLLFIPLDAVLAGPTVVDPVPLVLAGIGGLALAVAAALATVVVTSTPERAQITTLPLAFLILGAASVIVPAPQEGWWGALIAVPGAAIGQLIELALVGGTWSAGPGGLPAVLPALVATVAWPVLFALFARSRFRWDVRR
jgi:ABC-2 type transport system permease protein